MPLSEHEQRVLDQIERALYQDDPKFASTVRATDLHTHMRRRLRRAAFVLVLGFLTLLYGLVRFEPPLGTLIGVTGFVVMVGALLLAMSSWKRLGHLGGNAGGGGASGGGSGGANLQVAGSAPRPQRPARGKPPRSGGAGGSGSSFKDKLEQRWKRRWEERGGEGR